LSLSLVFLALLAAIAAAAAAWAVASDRRAREAMQSLAGATAETADARAKLATSQQAEAALRARLDAEQRSAAEKLALLEQARESLKDAFAAVSSDLLAQNNARFLDLANSKFGELQNTAVVDLAGRQKAIADLVQPLQESLKQVDARLQDVDRDRATSHAALTEQIRSLAHAQLALQSETGRLARALRSPNVRGQWGELQLRRVL
jgi:DNA recombination protein RmuC